ncbi:hypothetical protein NDU88_010481 [Pleurodeles waltl]|uniref:Uncharacterized protein n=1 Tax=Pleurodeles waltl TaxID=8319 RepID=A0AAV7QUJ1_PLEWA|nr:hypothetical protein NDU88_010481 [Pleurodeles waltl]
MQQWAGYLRSAPVSDGRIVSGGLGQARDLLERIVEGIAEDDVAGAAELLVADGASEIPLVCVDNMVSMEGDAIRDSVEIVSGDSDTPDDFALDEIAFVDGSTFCIVPLLPELRDTKDDVT